MVKYKLTEEEDWALHMSIMLPAAKRSLYEYLCHLPLTTLEIYPQKGWTPRMGEEARSEKALAMRDYIYYWRLKEEVFRIEHPRSYLESLPRKEQEQLLYFYLAQTPVWVYQTAIQDLINILGCI